MVMVVWYYLVGRLVVQDVSQGDTVRLIQAKQPLNFFPLLSTPCPNPRETSITQSIRNKQKAIIHRGPLTAPL